MDWYLNPKRVPIQAVGHFFTNFPIKNRPNIKRLKILPLEQIPDSCKTEVCKNFDSKGKGLIYNLMQG